MLLTGQLQREQRRPSNNHCFHRLYKSLAVSCGFSVKVQSRIMQSPDSPVSVPDAEAAHVYMPSFPLLRGLPAFADDSERGNEEERSSKFHRRHNRLTPGIFTIFCGHGVCLGFKLMVNKEGPATAFDLPYTYT